MHHVIADITGAAGLAMLDAIRAGQRDPARLAALRDHPIKAPEEVLRKALVGNYREEHLFRLAQALAGHRFVQSRRSWTWTKPSPSA